MYAVNDGFENDVRILIGIAVLFMGNKAQYFPQTKKKNRCTKLRDKYTSILVEVFLAIYYFNMRKQYHI